MAIIGIIGIIGPNHLNDFKIISNDLGTFLNFYAQNLRSRRGCRICFFVVGELLQAMQNERKDASDRTATNPIGGLPGKQLNRLKSVLLCVGVVWREG